jgi:hypothetical protein
MKERQGRINERRKEVDRSTTTGWSEENTAGGRRTDGSSNSPSHTRSHHMAGTGREEGSFPVLAPLGRDIGSPASKLKLPGVQRLQRTEQSGLSASVALKAYMTRNDGGLFVEQSKKLNI